MGRKVMIGLPAMVETFSGMGEPRIVSRCPDLAQRAGYRDGTVIVGAVTLTRRADGLWAASSSDGAALRAFIWGR